MINELKVFYESEKGLMTFDNKKTIFQHREGREGVDLGLGVIIEDSIFDKGTYGFAIFKNVTTTIPKTYFNIGFFNNRGVPSKVEKGVYGSNILLKETYTDRTYIRAYKEDGTVGLYESQIIKNADYEGPNIYFNRLEDVIVEWEDITESVLSAVFESVKELDCTLNLSNEIVLGALRGLGKNTIYRLDSGVIVADGKFESLIIWSDSSEIKMAWLGRKIDFTQFNYEDITEDVLKLVRI